jgi:putative endonuclease
MKTYFVYIMSSTNGTLYVGMTSDLRGRVYQHKSKEIPGHTAKYNITELVYYDETPDVHSAIAREKELKGWTREKKDKLIRSMNPEWKDLSEDWEG